MVHVAMRVATQIRYRKADPMGSKCRSLKNLATTTTACERSELA